MSGLEDNTGQEAGTSGVLSEFAGPYVSDMLGQAQALGNQPYQAYTGPLTADASGLQNQAFAGYAGLDPNRCIWWVTFIYYGCRKST